MKTMYWATAALTMLSACSDKIAEPDGGGSAIDTAQPSSVSGARRTATVTIPSRSANDVKGKAAALLRLFPGGLAVTAPDVDAAVEAQPDMVLGSAQVPRVRVDYEAKFDTFRAVDLELAKVRDGVEVSEAVARQRFEAVTRAAIAAGIVGKDEYSLTEASVSRLMQGEGDSSGAPPVESVKEYRFFIPREVDGIVLNDGGQRDFGLKVMIHRSGALRGIHISAAGASVTFAGAVTASVEGSELDRRVEADFTSSTIQPLGLRYSLNGPNGEPRQAYRVSLRTVTDGKVTNSRAKTVYYFITDPSRPPEIWPTPNPDDRSDQPRTSDEGSSQAPPGAEPTP